MSRLPIKFDAQGLVPAIVQDFLTGDVRMFAYATDSAVRKTVETGLATFWSRSRGELWQKGRISGHETPTLRVLADCAANALIYSSDPTSPSCNSGAPSCFFQALDGDRIVQSSEQPQTLLASLEAELENRKKSDGESSYTKSLYDAGPAGIGAKVREEAGEFADALEHESDERVVSEAADAIYHLLVGLRFRSISLRRVFAELARRAGKSGHEEKASR